MASSDDWSDQLVAKVSQQANEIGVLRAALLQGRFALVGVKAAMEMDGLKKDYPILHNEIRVAIQKIEEALG